MMDPSAVRWSLIGWGLEDKGCEEKPQEAARPFAGAANVLCWDNRPFEGHYEWAEIVRLAAEIMECTSAFGLLEFLQNLYGIKHPQDLNVPMMGRTRLCQTSWLWLNRWVYSGNKLTPHSVSRLNICLDETLIHQHSLYFGTEWVKKYEYFKCIPLRSCYTWYSSSTFGSCTSKSDDRTSYDYNNINMNNINSRNEYIASNISEKGAPTVEVALSGQKVSDKMSSLIEEVPVTVGWKSFKCRSGGKNEYIPSIVSVEILNF